MTVKGKHPHKALSTTFIRTVGTAGRYADGNGLYLIVDPSGAKRWVLSTVVMARAGILGLAAWRW